MKRKRRTCKVCKKRRTSVRKVVSMSVAACEKCRNLELPFESITNGRHAEVE